MYSISPILQRAIAKEANHRLQYRAARKGNLQELRSLIELEPDSVSYTFGRGETLLHIVCRKAKPNCLEVAKYLVKEKGALISSPGSEADTVIMCAVKGGNLELLQWLVKTLGTDEWRYEKDSRGWTVFHFACYHGHIPICDWLLDIDPSMFYQKTYKLNTPMLCAIYGGCEEMVNYLLVKGASFDDKSSENRTALPNAAVSGNLNLIKRVIVEGKADLEAADLDDQTSLLTAATLGFADAVKYLISQGANVHQVTSSAMESIWHLSAFAGNVELLEWLSSPEVHLDDPLPDPNVENAICPMMAAAFGGHVEALIWLLDFYFPEVKASSSNSNGLCSTSSLNSSSPNGTTIRKQKGFWNKKRFREYVFSEDNYYCLTDWPESERRYFSGLKYPILFDLQENGDFIIHQAAKGGSIRVVQYLLNHGCSIFSKSQNANGYNAFQYAAAVGHIDLVKYLVLHSNLSVFPDPDFVRLPREGDEDISSTTAAAIQQNVTTLHASARGGNLRTFKWLLHLYPNYTRVFLNSKDSEDRNLLHSAVGSGSLPMVQYLVQECGLDIHARRKSGETAILEAVYYDHLQVVRWLLAHGADISDKNTNGFTPFLAAIYFGHSNLAKWLLENGASLSECSHYEFPASYYAITRGHISTLQLLFSDMGESWVNEYSGSTKYFLWSRDITSDQKDKMMKFLRQNLGVDIEE